MLLIKSNNKFNYTFNNITFILILATCIVNNNIYKH